MKYEAVIGLEVHVQVRTQSKMYSSVGAGYGHPENTLTDPTVLGLPGALPVPNYAAIEAIIKSGLMLGCTIAPVCKFDRKNYFYPDSPKNYQISQYDQPFCTGGSVEIELPGPSRNVMGEHKSIPLTRIHLEEDVGKLTHTTVDSLVDLNRAGTPLMEIVTEPAIHTADEAFALLTSLRLTLVNGGISDCDMEKGQMRCDANISIRPVGETKLGTKVELKNLNSISFVRDGIRHEVARQIGVIEAGGSIVQETRGYDGETGVSVSQRSKEMAHDYRYFPDPDLMPIVVDETWKERLQAACPENPFDRQRRYLEQYGLPYTMTSVFVPDRALCEYFEEAAKDAKKPQDIANWIANDLLKELSAAGVSIADAKVRPTQLAALVALVDQNVLSVAMAREVLSEMFKTGGEAAAIVDRRGLRQSTDTGQLEEWARAAIAANPTAVADFRAGKEAAINSLKGFVMKQSKGKANPRVVDEIMRRILAEG